MILITTGTKFSSLQVKSVATPLFLEVDTKPPTKTSIPRRRWSIPVLFPQIEVQTQMTETHGKEPS